MRYGVVIRSIFGVLIAFCQMQGTLAWSMPCQDILLLRKLGANSISNVQIPPLTELHLPLSKPTIEVQSSELSAGIVDPVLEAGRRHAVVDDFKTLSDATPRQLTKEEKNALSTEKIYLGDYIDRAYETGEESLPVPKEVLGNPTQIHTGNSEWDAAFEYAERTWDDLVRIGKPRLGGSLLSLPYPYLVPAGRFQEAYYWDTYFGVLGLLSTGRLELAQMQVENMLSFVQSYGMIPNGARDYYLSRSQPPMLSSLVREVYDHSENNPERLKWMRERAYPLMRIEYEGFWMKPERYDSKTGLNHHWDDLGAAQPRPERHSKDNESKLGRTYLDVRAAAESGLDFTDAFEGEASNIAGMLLNSLLYKTERDLEWAATELGNKKDARFFADRAKKRRQAMQRYLWNERKGRFENYNLRTNKRIDALTADTFAPLFAKVATPDEAERVLSQLQGLEQAGGLMSSELTESLHQWDGYNGWAPHQVLAIQGLQNYGYHSAAQRIASKWVAALAHVHSLTGAMYERIDVRTLSLPKITGSKYPTQKGFLWTNASYEWALIKVLKLHY